MATAIRTLLGRELGRVWRQRQRSILGLVLMALIPLTAVVNEASLARHRDRQRQGFERTADGGAMRVEMPPPPLVGLDGALYAALPTEAVVDAAGVVFAPNELADNPAIALLGRIDPLTIVTLLLSLAALVMSFDMIAAERESGTLQLVLVRGVSRVRLLRAKIASRWLVLTLPLALGLALAAALVVPAGEPLAGVALRLAGLVVLGSLYLGVFIHLAALVSTALRRPVACLLTLLLAWILLVVVVPPVGALMAETAYPVAHQTSWTSPPVAGAATDVPGERIEQARQVELASLLTAVSPAAPLIRGFRVLCGTEGDDFARFTDAVVDYQRRLAETGAAADGRATGPEIARRGAAEALAAALPAALHLGVYNLVLLGFAQAYFRRRPLRLP